MPIGGPGEKRSAFERAIDREILTELLATRPTWTHQNYRDEIFRRTGRDLTRQQISYDIDVLLEDIRERTMENMEKIVEREAARLDALEEKLWQAWEASSDPIKREIIDEIIKEVDGELSRVITNIRTIKEYNPGDLRIIENIIRVQRERRQLLGAYQAQRVEIGGQLEIEVKGYANVSPDDWDNNNGDTG